MERRMSGDFAFKWRVIEPWHEPAGPSTHALFTRAGNIFLWADMMDPQPLSPLGRYVEQVREWGFNGMSFYADPEQDPAAMRNFARFLKERGIAMIIRREWCETELGSSWPVSISDATPPHFAQAVPL